MFHRRWSRLRVAVCDAEHIHTNEFKAAGHSVGLIAPEYRENGLPTPESQKHVFDEVTRLLRSGEAVSASALRQRRYGACGV